ncbi:MAG: hypothetical protein ACRBCJ_12715 [Hyphomicrobiaceae bacterium]
MGWDVKATTVAAADAIGNFKITPPTMDQFQQVAIPLAIALSVFLVARWLLSPMLSRFRQTVEDTIFSSWQLALLATTGLILSLASGWTTWDGMRNFTNEPFLSLLITFGIQGVMLIVAWLIGESFATGMKQKGREGAIGVVGMAAAIIAAVAIVGGIAALAIFGTPGFSSHNMAFAAIFIGIVGFIGAMQMDVIQPYFQSGRVILKNAVLWVMFLACMTTSVFFSFDSLFSQIFPQSERVRAAELRAQNQVAGIIADIGSTIGTRRLQEAERLFENEGWLKYETQLDRLGTAAQGAQAEIERYFVAQMEERRKAIAEQQQRRATAERSQVGLKAKKVRLTEELSRLQANRPAALTAVEDQTGVLSDLQKALDEQRAKTLAEERGVEGSGKQGRGQFYRASKAEEARIRSQIEVARRRLKAPQVELKKIDSRVGDIKAELVQIDADIATLAGEATTADQRITAAESRRDDEEAGPRVDPARVYPAFEKAKVEFRQDPSVERLGSLQQQCSQLLDAMSSTPVTKTAVRDIDCDPKAASEAAAIVFALNTGANAFGANCAGGQRLEAQNSTDALFAFARKCLADSGLPSDNTDKLRGQINLAELNRDDKAHRFVVTWNAFQDGNRLAYLAMAIAIAIDSLVFMSGLFGANAVRSPLSDVPSYRARSAKQLESIVENALLPNKYDNADALLTALRPITPLDGFTHEVIVPYDETPNSARLVKVLNAAAAIGAVAHDEYRKERYLVRPELFEFVSSVAKKTFDADDDHGRISDLKHVVTVALQPHVGDHAQIVLGHCHPITEQNGFSSEIIMPDIPEHDRPIVRNVLNAGSTLQYVSRDERQGEAGRYYVHSQLYKTLALISASNPMTGNRLHAPQLAAPQQRDGGALHENTDAIASQPAPKQVEPPVRQVTQQPVPSNQPGAQESRQPPQEPQLTQDELNKLSYQCRSSLLNALGLNIEDVDRRLASDGVGEASLNAWQALQKHAATNERLKVLLSRNFEAHQQKLAEMYSSLRSANSGNTQTAKILDQVDIQVGEELVKLMLFPEVGLIKELIEQLEAAAAYEPGLNNKEHNLLVQLRRVQLLLDQSHEVDDKAWREINAVLAEPLEIQDQPEEEIADIDKIVSLFQKQPDDGDAA